MSRSTSFVIQIGIKIVVAALLLLSFFLDIKFLKGIQLGLIIYLAYLLIVPPIIQYKQNPEKIQVPIRKKFVTAKEELDKAVETAAKHPEDAMGYVRTAIDLEIKHKFGFTKIISMHGFFHDAEKFDLPLPSYSLIYTIFNEGSKRLHEGKIHTNFEVSQSIETVTNFIAELEKSIISQDIIDNFKIHSKSVE